MLHTHTALCWPSFETATTIEVTEADETLLLEGVVEFLGTEATTPINFGS